MRIAVLWSVCLMLIVAACTPVQHLKTAEKAEVSVVKQVALKAPQVLVETPLVPVKKEQKRHGKHSFIKLMKPMVQMENQLILKDRRTLLRLQKQKRLSVAELHNLREVAQRYRVDLNGKQDQRFWHKLLRRVDIVPLDLVIAQAANESSWGNSRFAREGNNYFGQWCYTAGCGLVPLRRNSGAHHEVKRFDSPRMSVRAYIRNLNVTPAYAQFRKLRLSLRRSHKKPDAEFLALGLKGYSERGMAYVKSIRRMVRANRNLVRSL